MSVEESPLLLRYNPKSEEQARVAGHGLASNSHEAVLLAHKVPAARGSECTINWRVTLNDPYGRSKEEYPVFWNYMGGLEYPTDVRAGDPRCTFPARLLPVLVNRCELVTRMMYRTHLSQSCTSFGVAYCRE